MTFLNENVVNDFYDKEQMVLINREIQNNLLWTAGDPKKLIDNLSHILSPNGVFRKVTQDPEGADVLTEVLVYKGIGVIYCHGYINTPRTSIYTWKEVEEINASKEVIDYIISKIE